MCIVLFFFFSSRRRHTRWTGDWSSDVCSSDLLPWQRERKAVENGLIELGFLVVLGALETSLGRQVLVTSFAALSPGFSRSEERRVGKECRFRWWRYQSK